MHSDLILICLGLGSCSIRSPPGIFWHAVSFPAGVFALQYLPECDEVVLMKDGQIAEHGTHVQLMEKGRDYAALFNSMQQEVRYAARSGAVLWENTRVTRSQNILHYLLQNSWATGFEMLIHTMLLSFISELICGRNSRGTLSLISVLMTQQPLFGTICSVNQVRVALYQVSLFLFFFILHPEPSEEEPEKQAEGRGGKQPAVLACRPRSQTAHWEQERRWGWIRCFSCLFSSGLYVGWLWRCVTIAINLLPKQSNTKRWKCLKSNIEN